MNIMKNIFFSLLASLVAGVACAGNLAILQPTGTEPVWLLSKMKMDYLKLPLAERVAKFADAGERGILASQPNEPTPLLVSWKWSPDAGEMPPVFTVTLVKRTAGGELPVAFKTAREPYVFFTNLEIGTDCRVDVRATIGGEAVATASRDFSTDKTAPRLLAVPGVPNVRDVGGRVGFGGRRMKQGLVFRTAGLNDNPEDTDFLTWAECRAEFDAGTLTKRNRWQAGHMADIYRGKIDANDWHRVPTACARGRERLTDASRRILLEDLGIRTDLDLRSAGEVAGMRGSPLGDRVNWINVPFEAYKGLGKTNGIAAVKAAFDVFLDPANYPILFHCIGGQDRTGTLAYLLEALLGVDDDELAKDWECSGFTNAGNWFRHETLYNQIPEFLKAYPGETTRARVEAYLKACGLKERDFATLRALLLESPVSGGEVSSAEEIPFAKVGGHTHHMRKNGVTEAVADAALFAWAAKHDLAAFGLGSPWTAANREEAVFNEKTDRDRYFGGFKTNAWATLMDVDGNARKLAELNAKGGGTLYYLDNETPKSVFGHLWYIGFKQTVPSWHDYNQDRACWYSSYDDGKAERNALTGDYHKRRSYVDIVAEQRAHGALAIWAHPTSWWTTDGKNKGPFVTNIATDMIPQLMRDGYLDGMTVQGYDKYNRPYQALWFALLDLGYRVPGYSELDVSPSYGLDTKDSMLFNWIPYMSRPVTLDAITRACRAAHHTMSSGPKLLLKVDGELQGAELESGAGRTHAIEVFAWPAKGEKTLSRVQLLGRGGRILAEKRDFAGGKISWKLAGDADGGYILARVFGEHDGDYAAKPQQQVRQCALTNPVWLRTDAFRAPKPIPAPDPLTIPEIRKLEDFLLKGEFRFDPRVKGELAPGEVPVWAFQIDKVREALLRAAASR